MRYTLGLICSLVAACESPAAIVDSSNTLQCWDDDPCSFDFHSDKYGCTHEQMPNDTSCFDDRGIGLCANGECVHYFCEDGSVDLLQGTCKLGQCVNGLYRIVPKIAGVPCVISRPVDNPPWIEGTCDMDGTCVSK